MTEIVIGQNEVSNEFNMAYSAFVSDEKTKLYEAFRTTFPGIAMKCEIESEFKNRGVDVGLSAIRLYISPGDHTNDMAKKLAIWKFDNEAVRGSDICYVAYIGMRGTTKYGLNAAHIEKLEDKYAMLAKDIKKYLTSNRSAITEHQIIIHFDGIYTEHDIKACMTPLLISGVIKEKVVYTVND